MSELEARLLLLIRCLGPIDGFKVCGRLGAGPEAGVAALRGLQGKNLIECSVMNWKWDVTQKGRRRCGSLARHRKPASVGLPEQLRRRQSACLRPPF
jgi:hypothetical protein